MKNIAVIGAGISGLTVAQLLKERCDVTVFEREDKPGGLIKCRRVKGNLFHTCGGHVFNSKRQDVLEWFWKFFRRELEFAKAERNSVVFMENACKIPYPIENHMYLFDEVIQRQFIDDLINIERTGKQSPVNFEEFLKGRFGNTLYELYFRPYNEKIWRRDLKSVPLSWLEGKLPMPTVADMFYNNINHVKEKEFVHSTFWYERKDGSQFIADRLSEDLNIRYGISVDNMTYIKNRNVWEVAGHEYDYVIYCGNIKEMICAIQGLNLAGFREYVEAFEYHGTTAVFCEIDKNPYSWIYLPSLQHDSHRIICTGNFASSNNMNLSPDKISATVEFTDRISMEDIFDNLKCIPLHPRYLDCQYNQYTYPIQDVKTRETIRLFKNYLMQFAFSFTGRFADWEYYNMDVAIGAAIDLVDRLSGDLLVE